MDYAETEAGLLLRQEMARGRLDIALGWRQVHRNYNSSFNERDNDNNRWQMRVNGRPFRHRGLRIGFLGHGPSSGRVELTWLPQTRTYTTTNPYDVTRYQRVNHREQVGVQVTQRVMGPFEPLARYKLLTSDATFPEGVDISSDVTDFDQTRYGLMLRGRWDLLRR